MRANVIIVLLALVVAGSACKKEKKNIIAKPTPVDTSIKGVAIKGDADLKIMSTGTASTKVSISPLDNRSYKVNISLEGLPKNTTSSLVASGGMVPLTSAITFSTKNEKAGTYTIPVTATPDKGMPVSFDLKLTVAAIDSADWGKFFYNAVKNSMLKTYRDTADQKNDLLNITMSPSGEVYLNKVLLYKEDTTYTYVSTDSTKGGVKDVKLTVDCATDSLYIMPQSVNGINLSVAIPGTTYMISGKGHFDRYNKTFTITYHVTHPNPKVNETFTIKGKMDF
ncbi:MAG: hypothetical protein H6551_11455 [Chitinophagales bacterium]|nr:hypothetical protein [Chitinophagaceae bacterium]MCB9065743.1 hypothetical protein [Chitinophagales bacterium]